METARPLPPGLVNRYRNWSASIYPQKRAEFQRLVAEGQSPSAMIIACCDSRVQVATLFGAEPGEFFTHLNIANLVPPYEPDGNKHGTSAAIEYAVTVLQVQQLIVMGHSQCGGVAGCHAMCSGNAPQLEEKTSFVGRWIEVIRPAFEKISKEGDEAEQLLLLEQESVLLSLENLMTFPFVANAVAAEKLTLHGLWKDIAEGELMQFDAASNTFQPV